MCLRATEIRTWWEGVTGSKKFEWEWKDFVIFIVPSFVFAKSMQGSDMRIYNAFFSVSSTAETSWSRFLWDFWFSKKMSEQAGVELFCLEVIIRISQNLWQTLTLEFKYTKHKFNNKVLYTFDEYFTYVKKWNPQYFKLLSYKF